MTARKVGVPDVAPGAGVAEYRTREAALGCEQYLIEEADRVTSYRGMVASFRIVGNSKLTNRALATLFNVTGSGVLVAIHRLVLSPELAGASGSTRTVALSKITTAPTDGALGAPLGFDSAQTHNASVEFRGASSADGVAVALTAPPGTVGYRALKIKNPSHIGQIVFPDVPLIPDLYDPGVLREGEGIVVTDVEAGSTAAHYFIQAVIEEFTL
jgi:hypothetical protein